MRWRLIVLALLFACSDDDAGDVAEGGARAADAASETGDAATGDAATGDAATGDAATGDAATRPPEPDAAIDAGTGDEPGACAEGAEAVCGRGAKSCSELQGGHACICRDGYSGTGTTACTDVDECDDDNGGCDPLRECVNTAGSHRCGDCAPGYEPDGDSSCADVDECETDNGDCDPLVSCTNDEGGRTCGDCPDGYDGDGESGCTDIDECDDDNGGCDSLTECVNEDGGRSCGACPAGYSGDGEAGCVDVDECAAGAVAACGLGAIDCEDEDGGYSCTCGPGFSGTGTTSCDDCGAPMVPRIGETCYRLAAHAAGGGGGEDGGGDPGFGVQPGESYNQFYYAVPWPADTVVTRFGVAVDHPELLVHAWTFDTSSSEPDGAVVANVTGTTIGQDATLFAAWSSGACHVELPSDVGLRLPEPGRKIMVQWHHRNTSGDPVADASSVELCTVPAAMRAHTAGFTMLGTESFNGPLGMPPGTWSFGGSCVNDSGAPIRVIRVQPHMHQLGSAARMTIDRVAGGDELVHDQPFSFGDAVYYDADFVLQPGDVLESECTFVNDTSGNVAFGQSVSQEMCYLNAIAYPVDALNNDVLSLIGAKNVCW